MAGEVFAESDRGRFRLKSDQETTPSFSNTGVLQLQCLYVYSIVHNLKRIEDYVEEALKNTLKNWTESSLWLFVKVVLFACALSAGQAGFATEQREYSLVQNSLWTQVQPWSMKIPLLQQLHSF